MHRARPTTRLRARLIIGLSLIVLGGALAVFAIGEASLSFGGASADGISKSGARTKRRLAATREKLWRAQHRVELVADGRRRLRRRLDRATRLAARRDRLLRRIRGAAGGKLPLTDDSCSVSLALAAVRGLRVPDEYALHCPGPGLDWNGASHWGVTCPYSECPEGAGPYISISSPTYYVVAHELCHAVFGYGASPEDEASADACAAEHGASLATSPYR
jgi:hypothetical protein